MKKVIIACYGGGHVTIAKRLYAAYKAHSYDVTILAFTMATYELSRENIPFLSYVDFLDLYKNKNEAIETGSKLAVNIDENSKINREETIAYLGLNFLELQKTYGKEEAYNIYQKRGRYSFFPFEIMLQVLTKIKPDFVITTNSPRSEAAVLLAAKKLKIPSYFINDFYNINELNQRTGNPNYARKVFVALPKIRDVFIEFGWNKNNVVCSGNPAFDDIFDKQKIIIAKNLMTEYFNNNKINILYIGGNGEFTKKSDEVIMNTLETKIDSSKVNLIYRAHPNNKFDNVKEGIHYSPNNISVHSYLHISDLVINCSSTVGLEAYICGIPVIQYIHEATEFPQPFEYLGIGKQITNEEILLKEINHYINKNIKVLHDYNPNNKKSATDIIIYEIEKDLNNL
ncbi:hypothetical protein [Halobacteriovorax sp. ZH1_bin.1]|uniref:hypothetical protein n=1 Tax=Halobacteriovorax sp. ZH1_bin.1 TaxID=3157723 RepID=UPI003720A390